MISKAQYQYTMRDADTNELYDAATRLRDALSPRRRGSSTSTAISISRRRRSRSAINRDRAAALGISIQSIETALGASFGGQQVSLIETPVDQFKVMLELLPQYQQDAARACSGSISPARTAVLVYP